MNVIRATFLISGLLIAQQAWGISCNYYYKHNFRYDRPVQTWRTWMGYEVERLREEYDAVIRAHERTHGEWIDLLDAPGWTLNPELRRRRESLELEVRRLAELSRELMDKIRDLLEIIEGLDRQSYELASGRERSLQNLSPEDVNAIADGGYRAFSASQFKLLLLRDAMGFGETRQLKHIMFSKTETGYEVFVRASSKEEAELVLEQLLKIYDHSLLDHRGQRFFFGRFDSARGRWTDYPRLHEAGPGWMTSSSRVAASFFERADLDMWPRNSEREGEGVLTLRFTGLNAAEVQRQFLHALYRETLAAEGPFIADIDQFTIR